MLLFVITTTRWRQTPPKTMGTSRSMNDWTKTTKQYVNNLPCVSYPPENAYRRRFYRWRIWACFLHNSHTCPSVGSEKWFLWWPEKRCVHLTPPTRELKKSKCFLFKDRTNPSKVQVSVEKASAEGGDSGQNRSPYHIIGNCPGARKKPYRAKQELNWIRVHLKLLLVHRKTDACPVDAVQTNRGTASGLWWRL